MYGFLRQPKWIALTVLLVFVVPLSALAAHWQFDRWEERKSLNALVAANAAAPVVPMGALVAAGATVADPDEWRLVTVTGRYAVERQVLVRKQPLGGRNGFLVVTPLVTSTGVVAVERGWLPADSDARAVPVVPEPPAGEVTATGRLRAVVPRDQPQPADLPAGQVNWIDPGALAAGSPAYLAALELTSSSPDQAPGLTPIPAPELSEGPHLSYVGQWILIGITSIVVWIIVVRREAAHRRRSAAEAALDHAV